MNHRDIWFVGLLALAYLYLDAAGPALRRGALTRQPQLEPVQDGADEEDAVSFEMVDACPRDFSHAVSLRGDGAKWCLSCDEAFYPAALVI
jgi:hypothetical protein